MLLKYDVLTQEQVKIIHDETMRILEEVGMDFEYEPALEVFRAEGQKVEGNRVHFTREFIEAKVKLAPSEFIFMHVIQNTIWSAVEKI